MMMKQYWEQYFATHTQEQMPWFIGRPDHNLVSWMSTQALKPRRILDLGCGHGDNAIWLAQQGFEVTATDISDTAVSQAKERAKNLGVNIHFCINNAIDDLPIGPFDLVFDRGLFHQFNYIEDRPKVVKNISNVLASEGTWLSIIGSTECCQDRELTPPRRSVIDIALAVEPYLRIERIQASTEEMFTEKGLEYCSAWLLICKKRTVPARPWIPKSSQSL
jgi:methyl halide transferase